MYNRAVSCGRIRTPLHTPIIRPPALKDETPPTMTTKTSAAESAPSVRLGFDPRYLRKFQDNLFMEGPTARRRLLN